MRILSKKLVSFLLICFVLVVSVSCEDTDTQDNTPTDTKSEYDQWLDSEMERMMLDFSTLEISNEVEVTNRSDYQDNIVYVSQYGKIHKNPNCSGMKYCEPMSYSTAISRDYVLCNNCY